MTLHQGKVLELRRGERETRRATVIVVSLEPSSPVMILKISFTPSTNLNASLLRSKTDLRKLQFTFSQLDGGKWIISVPPPPPPPSDMFVVFEELIIYTY